MNWKIIVGFIPCYVFYGLGHLTYHVGLYIAYNRLMGWSCRINDWAGLALWKEVKEEDKE